MSRVIEAFAQFFTDDGDPLVSGYLEFLYSGTTSSKKDTYADADQTTANTNPVQLDAAGRCPDVFGRGDYKVISYTKNPVTGLPGAQVQVFDPVLADRPTSGGGDNFAEWDSTIVYGVADIVVYNERYYRSYVDNNLNNEPDTNLDKWEEVQFVRPYNEFRTYAEDDMVTYDGNIYVSLQDANQGNTPDISPTWWSGFGSGTVLLEWEEFGTTFRPKADGTQDFGDSTHRILDIHMSGDIGTSSDEISDIYIKDSGKVYFGNDQDATIQYHNGLASLFYTTLGLAKHVFRTDTNQEALVIDENQDANFRQDIYLKDNKKLILGESDDLSIYWDSGLTNAIFETVSGGMVFSAGGNAWRISGAGIFRPDADGTYDFGQAGLRIRESYFKSTMFLTNADWVTNTQNYGISMTFDCTDTTDISADRTDRGIRSLISEVAPNNTTPGGFWYRIYAFDANLTIEGDGTGEADRVYGYNGTVTAADSQDVNLLTGMDLTVRNSGTGIISKIVGSYSLVEIDGITDYTSETTGLKTRINFDAVGATFAAISGVSVTLDFNSAPASISGITALYRGDYLSEVGVPTEHYGLYFTGESDNRLSGNLQVVGDLVVNADIHLPDDQFLYFGDNDEARIYYSNTDFFWIVPLTTDITPLRIGGSAAQWSQIRHYSVNQHLFYSNLTLVMQISTSGLEFNLASSRPDDILSRYGDSNDASLEWNSVNSTFDIVADGGTFEFSTTWFESNLSQGFSCRRTSSTSTLPVFTFVADKDTGIGWAGSNTIALIGGGSLGISVDGGGAHVPDDNAIYFGDADEFSIIHGAGGNTNLTNDVGYLRLHNLSGGILYLTSKHATGTIRLQTDATPNNAIIIDENQNSLFYGIIALDLDGSDASNYISAGADDDIKLYHNGSNTVLDNDTGLLILRNNSAADIRIDKTNAAGSIRLRTGVTPTQALVVGADQAIDLYGTTSLLLDGSDSDGYFALGAGQDVKMYFDGNNAYIQTDASATNLILAANGGNAEVQFRTADTNRWEVASGGDLNPLSNRSYDIGDTVHYVKRGFIDLIQGPGLRTYAATTDPLNIQVDNVGGLGTATSTRETKENIEILTDTDWLYDLEPVSFNYKTDKTKRKQYGLIADDIEKLNPIVCAYIIDENGNKKLRDYSERSISAAMINEIKKLRSEIELLKQIQ